MSLKKTKGKSNKVSSPETQKINKRNIKHKRNTIVTTPIDNKILNQILEIIEKEVIKLKRQGIRGAEISSQKKYSDPFRVLIGCLISLRTKDEVTGPATDRLFKFSGGTAEKISQLSAEKIAELIYPAGFYRNKSSQIKQISTQLFSDYESQVPDDLDTLLSFKGVGRKTANLVITRGFNKPGICVDTHVARIVHRFGYISYKKINEKGEFVFYSADDVEIQLRKKLPKKWWIPINELLVTWGQNICSPISPKCSQCSVLNLCSRVGVKKSR